MTEEDEAECVSDTASIRTLSFDSSQFDVESEFSADALTQSDHIDSIQPSLGMQPATSPTSDDALHVGLIGGKRKAHQIMPSLSDSMALDGGGHPSKKRRVETTGALIGQHVGLVLDSFGRFPDFQDRIIKWIQDVMARASHDFFDIATAKEANVDAGANDEGRL